MGLSMWWLLIRETLRPMQWTWVGYFLPGVLLLGMILYFRQAGRSTDNAWRELGGRWLQVGAVVAGCLVVIMAVSYYLAYRSTKDDLAYQARLERDLFQRTRFTQQIDRLRNVLADLDDDQLRDVAMNYVNSLTGDARMKFFDMWTATPTYRTVYETPLQLFYWPPARAEEYARTHQGHRPAIMETDMLFTQEIAARWANKDLAPDAKRQLWSDLSTPQWRHFCMQFFADERRDTVETLMVNLSQYLGSDVEQLFKDVLEVRYPSSAMMPNRLAAILGNNRSAGPLRFFLNHHAWLREASWLVPYAVIAVWLLIAGNSMAKQEFDKLLHKG